MDITISICIISTSSKGSSISYMITLFPDSKISSLLKTKGYLTLVREEEVE